MQKNVLIFNKITRIRDVNDTSRHKDLIELNRINKRTQSIPPQESFKSIIYQPDVRSPLYRDYPIESCKDFNEADKIVRKKREDFKEQKNDKKTTFNFEYEIKKWDKMHKEYEKDKTKINYKKEKFKGSSGVNHGFNIISLKYEQNDNGKALMALDNEQNKNLNKRINSLYKRVNSNFDILTGMEHKNFVVHPVIQ